MSRQRWSGFGYGSRTKQPTGVESVVRVTHADGSVSYRAGVSAWAVRWLAVRCPRCKAKPDLPCRTSEGKTCPAHSERIAACKRKRKRRRR